MNRVYKAEKIDKKIEKLKLNTGDKTEKPKDEKKMRALQIRENIVKRATKEVKNGMYVNLGIGMPTLVP